MTQHAVGFTADTIYKLLSCAAAFEGYVGKDLSDRVSELIVDSGILTDNVRDEKASPWRDYQQILAELGLIYSTKQIHKICLTRIGRLYLSGGIGFSELIGLQAMRYQYPNGMKTRRIGAVKEQSVKVGSRSLSEFQAVRGVLIKPAVLVLRVLLELHACDSSPSLSTIECVAFLVPCSKNAEWPLAVADILSFRSGVIRKPTEFGARRNIQDWFRLLSKSDYFTLSDSDTLTLSDFALAEMERLRELCEQLEDPSQFWIPESFDKDGLSSWFNWYGGIDGSIFELTRGTEVTPEYIERNYVEGVDDEEAEASPAIGTSNLALSPIDTEKLSFGASAPLMTVGGEELLERIKSGMVKRHAKTVLHDQMVADIAGRLQSYGAEVFEDKNSVDILAIWSGVGQAIIEVKTVNRRNFSSRMRLSIGQVEEYSYRRSLDSDLPCDRAIAINASVDQASWYSDFLVERLKIGLICIDGSAVDSRMPLCSITASLWLERLGAEGLLH